MEFEGKWHKGRHAALVPPAMSFEDAVNEVCTKKGVVDPHNCRRTLRGEQLVRDSGSERSVSEVGLKEGDTLHIGTGPFWS